MDRNEVSRVLDKVFWRKFGGGVVDTQTQVECNDMYIVVCVGCVEQHEHDVKSSELLYLGLVFRSEEQTVEWLCMKITDSKKWDKKTVEQYRRVKDESPELMKVELGEDWQAGLTRYAEAVCEELVDVLERVKKM